MLRRQKGCRHHPHIDVQLDRRRMMLLRPVPRVFHPHLHNLKSNYQPIGKIASNTFTGFICTQLFSDMTCCVSKGSLELFGYFFKNSQLPNICCLFRLRYKKCLLSHRSASLFPRIGDRTLMSVDFTLTTALCGLYPSLITTYGSRSL